MLLFFSSTLPFLLIKSSQVSGFLLLVLISGCGGGNSSAQSIPEIPTPTQLPGLLIQIETEDYLVDSVKRGFKDELAKGVVSVPAEYYSSRFTTSYSLEPNVDEHDYVKYDGEYLFLYHQNYITSEKKDILNSITGNTSEFYEALNSDEARYNASSNSKTYSNGGGPYLN